MAHPTQPSLACRFPASPPHHRTNHHPPRFPRSPRMCHGFPTTYGDEAAPYPCGSVPMASHPGAPRHEACRFAWRVRPRRPHPRRHGAIRPHHGRHVRRPGRASAGAGFRRVLVRRPHRPAGRRPPGLRQPHDRGIRARPHRHGPARLSRLLLSAQLPAAVPAARAAALRRRAAGVRGSAGGASLARAETHPQRGWRRRLGLAAGAGLPRFHDERVLRPEWWLVRILPGRRHADPGSRALARRRVSGAAILQAATGGLRAGGPVGGAALASRRRRRPVGGLPRRHRHARARARRLDRLPLERAPPPAPISKRSRSNGQ